MSTALRRQKRRQVARACEECRAYRIKCDSGNPCANCQRKGRDCSNGDVDKVSSLALAEKKISELRSQVEALQKELQHERTQISRLPDTPESLASIGRLGAAPADGKKKLFNYGASLRAPRSVSDSFLGPSSLYYFTTRLVKPLNWANHSSDSQTSAMADGLVPRCEGGDGLSGEVPAAEKYGGALTHGIQAGISTKKSPETLIEEWNPIQEQYFTDRYWDSVHTSVLPILDEAEFKAHHQSLWQSGKSRKPSALVDAVVALCMQLGVPAVSGPDSGREEKADMTWVGQRYYRRSQDLLMYEMENPSLTTLQCYLLGALYVCAGSFHNMVDVTLAMAVRTAYILGLHLEPPESMSRKEKEKRRRLWWATYMLETKISMKLGRPFGINDSYRMPELPRDDNETAMLTGSMFAPIGSSETWLSFHRYNITLYRAVRKGHNAFFDTCAAVAGDQNIWKDPETLGVCAESLRPHIQSLNTWRDSIPDSLRTPRRDGGATLSVDGTTVQVETFSPLWLQRQRLLLELTYHSLSTNLFRPLISFAADPKPDSLAVDLANQCALHAIAFTKILHHVLTTMTILDSWNENFHWQWNAALTLIGFVLASPSGLTSQLAKDARSAIDMAAEVCEIYAKSFSVATRASNSIRELMSKVDYILSQKLQSVAQSQDDIGAEIGYRIAQVTLDPSNSAVLDLPIAEEGYAVPTNDGLYDMVMGVDFWGDMDVWWPNMGLQMEDVAGPGPVQTQPL